LRKQIVKWGLLEQRVSAGQQKGIPLPMLHGLNTHFSFIDTQANCLDITRASQLIQRFVSTAHGIGKQCLVGLFAMLHDADIMQKQDIYLANTQTLQTILE